MRPAYLVLDLLLILAVLLAVVFLAALWLPLSLLAVVGLSLWLIRKYHLDYLDDPDARRRGP